MPYATERFEDHAQEDSAARIARRIDRDLRLRARRRRAALIAAATALGVLVLVGGLSVAMARGRDTRDDDAARRQVAAISPVTASSEPTVTEAEAPTPSASTAQPSEAPAPKPKSSVQKASPKTAAKPTSKKAAPSSQSGILVRKCSGSGCHSTSEVSGGGLDAQSAEGAIQAMTDGGYVNLSADERAAVIEALTRK